MLANASYNTVSTPTFAPVGGAYVDSVDVTINCSNSGATIHYTTNGVNPTVSDPVYSSPINISSTTTLKAKAWKAGLEPSDTESATYIISGGSGSGAEVYLKWSFEDIATTLFQAGA